jgi:hypothetical protein
MPDPDPVFLHIPDHESMRLEDSGYRIRNTENADY